MTKLSQVISFFITLSLLFLLLVEASFAYLPTSKPSVTFGDLLSNFPSSSMTYYDRGNLSNKKQRIKELLERLEAFYNDSNSLQPTTYNLQPTPYIPLPTLMAGINEIVSNRQSVLGIQQTNPSQLPTSHLQPPTPPQPTAPSQLMTGNLNDNPIKTTYIIALLGDSMTDTLGRDLPHLRQLLTESYPNYSFALLNYGQGSTDLESGLHRLTNTTKYLDVYYPPLLSFKPDILVVESFAYNHWSGEKYDLDRQWLTIAKIIDTVKIYSPNTKIILAATIAPNTEIFGDGKLNWNKDLKWESAMTTKAYLQNLVNFAASQKYPLADSYHASMGNDGNGIKLYINGGDNLHPSNEGALLFSKKVVEAIKENNLITQ